MPPVSINYQAVVVAGLIPMVVGSLWYSPALFAQRWISAMGWRKEEFEKRKKKALSAYAVMLVGSLIMSCVLAHFVAYAAAVTAYEGMVIGFWAWLGFTATTALSSHMFEGRPHPLYLINQGFNLVSLLLMGALLAVWY